MEGRQGPGRRQGRPDRRFATDASSKEQTISTKRVRAALLVASVVAGLAVAAAPAQASECRKGGAVYICEYGVSVQKLPDGTRQEFVIGTDEAVWTRWTNTSGKWTGWVSMGGVAKSAVTITDHWSFGDPWVFSLVVKGSDGQLWVNHRPHEGNWTGWYPHPGPD
ncbi:hypothetical protein [Streptomyces sp. NPDC014685]|uniref:hypothetical protein n=1 Tax=Streptomyces sp. NPDC014685 TaxID=3364881 RepID=UPI0036F88362